mmetsp:Transcript_12347/g.23583  ORF Transcript_12347/g.23583 Transcript_12347/m.23583 type:complete len:211 (+) Transcript_12347:27-659(+)
MLEASHQNLARSCTALQMLGSIIVVRHGSLSIGVYAKVFVYSHCYRVAHAGSEIIQKRVFFYLLRWTVPHHDGVLVILVPTDVRVVFGDLRGDACEGVRAVPRLLAHPAGGVRPTAPRVVQGLSMPTAHRLCHAAVPRRPERRGFASTAGSPTDLHDEGVEDVYFWLSRQALPPRALYALCFTALLQVVQILLHLHHHIWVLHQLPGRRS